MASRDQPGVGTVYYVPGQNIDPGNLQAILAGGGVNRPHFASGTPYVDRDMVAGIHQGERILSSVDNRALVQAVRSMAATTSRAPHFEVYVTIGDKPVRDMVRVELREVGVSRSIAGVG